MSGQWQVKFGPCLVMPHPVRDGGILLVTKTECISGENESHPLIPVTKETVEEVLRRHGKEFLELIANFQKFVLGMVTVSQDPQPDGYSFYVERCYELNRVQRLSLLKYLASEIVNRATILGSEPGKYPDVAQFQEMTKVQN
jgi:hypothetical protein